jgi:predicted nucleic acid-binding protein
MIIADTSVWIDFLRQSNKELCDQMESHLDDGQIIGVSAVFGELLQGARNETEEKIIVELWNSLPKIDESELFIEAGLLSFRERLFTKGVGLIDAYILAVAKGNKAKIWTLDKKLSDQSIKVLKHA